MCGIAGILNFSSNAISANKLKAMTDSLAHRGPDAEGAFIDQQGQCALGHRRLAIIDLSQAGKQPFLSKDGRFALIFNGEIYNYIELRQMLEKQGDEFVTATDTEVLLKMFMRYGIHCLDHLEGMYAFAIWDKEKKELFCARDRFGEKPFFYCQHEQQVLFASEIKALWAAGVLRVVGKRSLYNYLLFGTVRDTNDPSSTFYENIQELPAAHYLKITNVGELQVKRYWDLEISHHNTSISFTAAAETFAHLLRQSVKKRLRSDVSVGSSLSGGLDSSVIAGLINQMKPEKQQQTSFSARFKNFEKDEGAYIKEVLKKYPSIKSYEVYPSADSAIRNLEKLLYFQDEPFNSLSISAQFEVMEKASQTGIKVLLDGQGADEYLAGYEPFHEVYLNELRNKDRKIFKLEKEAFEKYYQRKFDQPQVSAYLMSNYTGFYRKLAETKRRFTSPSDAYFMGIHPDIVREFQKDSQPVFKPAGFKEHLKYALQSKGLNDLLRYADRNSMANSLEVRLPFLNHQLVEFAMSLPSGFLINQGWTKYLLRRSMEDVLPEKVGWRKTKIGFAPPQKQWLQEKKFLEITEESKSRLLKEKVIEKVYPALDWHYVMLAAYM